MVDNQVKIMIGHVRWFIQYADEPINNMRGREPDVMYNFCWSERGI